MRLAIAKKGKFVNVKKLDFRIWKAKKYHRVVSINRPSGYEPDALPLRHDDDTSEKFNDYNNNICNTFFSAKKTHHWVSFDLTTSGSHSTLRAPTLQ